MLTGVSKVGDLNILSHLQDISFNSEYSRLCGYSQDEFEKIFHDELIGVDLDKLRQWYYGYNWTGDQVYNPYDILLFFFNGKKYKPYWMETGGNHSYIRKLTSDKNFNISQIFETVDYFRLTSSQDIGCIDPINILLQTGYLTIGNTVNERLDGKHLVKFPNASVRVVFSSLIVDQLILKNSFNERLKLCNFIQKGELQAIEERIKRMFESIQDNVIRNEIRNNVKVLLSVIYILIASCTLNISIVKNKQKDCIDIRVVEGGFTYTFRFNDINVSDKYELSSIAERDNHSHERTDDKKIIYNVCVHFDKFSQNLSFTPAA